MSDPTFRNYSTEQAKKYAEARGSYGSKLVELVIRHHEETGGNFDVLLDVGCGPGNATRDLALSFTAAVGVDPGLEMIQAAQGLGGLTMADQPISYHVASAENCTSVPGTENGVDLLTAAMAAHWFSMPEFWAEAAKVVKPGGTVALWTSSSFFCHPATPNAQEVQKALFRLELDALGPYELPPNRISRDMYDNLPLPWDVEPAVSAFPQTDFVRHEWDRDGVLTNGEDFFFDGGEDTVQELEKGFDTASMVTRWREDNPHLVGTEEDCVRVAMREVREASGLKADEKLRTGSSTVLLFFKRR
ncbi:S-adenosyl-L-methionine-dependent methyltransferase, partial [Aspergillus sclerotioniger CBS 115572]